MERLFNYLCIFSVLLAALYSLPINDTTIKNSAIAKKRGFSLGNVLNVVLGRQTSVAVTDSIYKALKDWILSYGTIKIVVWNKSQTELQDAKWGATNVKIEAPVSIAVENENQPAEIVAHYSKNFAKNNQKSLWVSYRIPNRNQRVCIYAKVEMSGFASTKTNFQYTVFETAYSDINCDRGQHVFVQENADNGYITKNVGQLTARCAFESYKLDYVLKVYFINNNQGNNQQGNNQGNNQQGNNQEQQSEQHMVNPPMIIPIPTSKPSTGQQLNEE